MGAAIIRIIAGGLMFFGHGLPKLSLYLLERPLWGPHIALGPVDAGKWIVMAIECFCALFVILGFFTRANAMIIGSMLVVTALNLKLPFFFQVITEYSEKYPVLIVPSKDLQLYAALCFFAIVLLGPGSFSIDAQQRRR